MKFTSDTIDYMLKLTLEQHGLPKIMRINIHDFMTLGKYTEKQVVRKNFFKKFKGRVKPIINDGVLEAVLIEI